MKELQPGQSLGHGYQVVRLIAQGGMAWVYEAVHEATGDRVAAKVMSFGRDDAEAATLLAREAILLARATHPNIVKFLEFVMEPWPCLFMELLEGETLDNVISVAQRDGRWLELPQVLAWADEICKALTWLHTQVPPIIFRDLKPSNVMLSSGAVRLLDAGIARVARGRTTEAIRGLGSIGFAPLEQSGIASTDPRTDVYSLGATVYNLLTGFPPAASTNRVLGETVIPVSQVRPELVPLDGPLTRMLALRKGGRFNTIREAQVALREAGVRCGSMPATRQAALVHEGEATIQLPRPPLA
ncbi:MAG: serine/threonine protein kinase [Candidatus Xenobia bacterium]